MRRLRAGALGLVLLLAAAAPALAQGPAAKLAGAKEEPAAPAPSVAELQAKLAAEREQVEAQRAEVAARRTAAASPEEQSALAAELDAVDRLLVAITEYAGILSQEAELEKREAAKVPPEAVTSLGAPPYDLDALNGLEDALAAQRARIADAERNAALAKDEAEASRTDLERREEERRRAREALGLVDGTQDPAAAVKARRELVLAELESRRAQIRSEFVQRVTKDVQRQLALLESDAEAIRAAIAQVRENLLVSPEQIEARVAKLDEREAQLAREQERTATRIAERETRLARAQRELEATPESAPALVAEVAAYRAELQTEQWRAAQLAERMTRLGSARELVRGRGRVLRGELSREELRSAAAKLEQLLDESRRNLRIQHARIASIRQDAERARADAERAKAEGSETAPWKEREARALEAAVELFQADVAPLEELRGLQQRASEDIGERVATRGLGGAVRAIGDGVVGLWGRELTSVDDRPITVGKIVVAVAVLGLGWLAAGLLSKGVGRLVRRRSGATEGAVRALESLAFYVLLALFFLIALRSVNIPLTAFTLAGGALAVGIGFGSQNVLNNFISGLILLTERPIQIGDIVELDGTQGEVERIGPRSTRIRTFESIHLIVPNSTFLEKTVINLTVSEDLARGQVEVGVAYGSDARQVEKLLHQVLKEHDLVLDDPAPVVLFQDFGESALTFRCLFWIRDVLQRGRVASDLRFRIDELFRENGIEIAFPQRDVHLDAKGGLAVRLVREGGGPGQGP